MVGNVSGSCVSWIREIKEEMNAEIFESTQYMARNAKVEKNGLDGKVVREEKNHAQGFQ